MKSSSSIRPSAAETVNITTTTATIRDHLSPLLPLLNAFNHRNKNQHHASHWWSHFSIFRRTLRTLVTSSVSRQDSCAVLPSRASWLRDRIIPRAYIPFSQLAADNQYAPLGLVLLAVVARVSSILAEVLPPKQSAGSAHAASTTKASPPPQSSTEADRGVAISRRDMSLAVPQPSILTNPLVSREVMAAPATAGGKQGTPKKKSKPKKSKQGDELSSLFGALE